MLKPRVVLVGAVVGLLSLARALQLSPGAGVAAAEQAQAFVPVTDEMLLDPAPEDWLMVHRTYDFQAYSPLDQINRENVAQLQLAWMRAMDSGQQEIRPLVYDGVMYIAHPNSDHLQALDAHDGRPHLGLRTGAAGGSPAVLDAGQSNATPGALRRPHFSPDRGCVSRRDRRPYR